MLKLSELTKELKTFAVNQAISDEEFLNAVLLPLVSAGRIKNKHGEEFHLNKARTSEIMNQKADVPQKLRNALALYGIKERTIEEMNDFVLDIFDVEHYSNLLSELINLAEIESVSDKLTEHPADIQNTISILLTELLFKAISESNLPDPDTVLIWKHGINSIDVQAGDLFRFGFGNRSKKKNIVVIPVNTAFDTYVTRKYEDEELPLVSEHTIHGQWLIRMEESMESFESLDQRITESLKRTGFKCLKEAKTRNGKRGCYPIGAVAILETKNAVYYLLAVTEFDEFNNARASSNDIDCAISSLLNVYDRFGLGNDLYLSLMGTGLSRAGLSICEAYELVINSLLTNQSKIHGSVHLVLRPEDREEINIKKED